MRKILLFMFLNLLVVDYAFSQDANWLKIITKQAGLDSARGTRIMCADINNDNYPDLLWATGNINKNRLGVFLNIADSSKSNPFGRKFVDFTKESGINTNRDINKTGRIIDVAALADIDNDGDLDLVTSIYYHRLESYKGVNDPGDRSEVMLNDGIGHFSLVQNSGMNTLKLVDTLPEGLVNCTGLAYLDYDYDGKLDLYMSTWFSDYKSNQEKNSNGYKMRDAILKGNADGTFSLQSSTGIESVVQPMYGVNITDWNNDGWQDIITSPYCRSGGSLFKNNANGTFTDATAASGYSAQKMGGDHGQALCQWEALPGDFDNDGDMDLLQINVHGGYDAGEGRSHLTINQGKEKNYILSWDLERLKRDAPPSTTHLGDDGGTWIDIDADTKLEAMIGQIGYQDKASGTNMAGQCRIYFLKQDSLGIFNEITDKLGLKKALPDGHSMEACDFDLDGDQDIFVSNLVKDTIPSGDSVIYSEHMQIQLLENRIGETKNWISLKLDPPADCNKSAIGARIKVYYGNKQQMREVQAGIGHFAGQPPLIQNFGMDADRIDSLVIRWPNKSLQTTSIKNPAMNVIHIANQSGTSDYILRDKSANAIIAVEDAHINFASTNVNSSSEFTVKIKNHGSKSLVLNAITLIDNNDNVFEISNSINQGTIIPANQEIPLIIKFTPKAREIYTAKLKIASNAINEPIALVEIKGFGFEAKPIIAHNNIVIPATHIDSVSTVDFKVFNRGEIEMKIESIELSGEDSDLYKLIGTIPAQIAANDSISLSITFAPKEVKPHLCSIIIKSDAYKSAITQINISAESYGPAPEIQTSNKLAFLSVGINENKTKGLSISNAGTADLIINSLSISPDDGIFSIDNKQVPITINKDSAYVLNVKFSPKEIKTYDAVLTIKSNDNKNKSLSVPLNGIGKKSTDISDNCNCSEFFVEAMPLPAKDYLTLRLKNIDINNSNIYIKIYDIRGSLVYSNEISNTSLEDITIKLPNLSKGMYNLNIQAGMNVDNLPIIIE